MLFLLLRSWFQLLWACIRHVDTVAAGELRQVVVSVVEALPACTARLDDGVLQHRAAVAMVSLLLPPVTLLLRASSGDRWVVCCWPRERRPLPECGS